MIAPDLHQQLDDAAEAQIPREEQAAAGLAAFAAIAEEWDLKTDEQRRLLGNPGRTRFFAMKRGESVSLSDDELDRLAYLTGIYALLNILYNAEGVRAWLTNPSRPDSIWRGQSPLDYLKTGRMEALIDVYRYLNGLRGAS